MKTSLATRACCILLAMFTASQAEQPAPTVHTIRFRQFTIPFELQEDVTPPVTVQLHVSSDRGATWRLVESIDQLTGKFQFRADQDGTYWFCSLTLYPDGRKLPTRFAAEIEVRVDTTHPTIQITPQVGPDGQITIECRANDRVFAEDGLKIEYLAGEERNWQPVPLEAPVQLVAPGSLLCRASWHPTTPSRLVVIKATARDDAGNITVTHQRVFLPSLSLRRPPENSSSLPVAPARRGSIPWPAENAPVAPTETPAFPDPESATPSQDEPGLAPRNPVALPLPRIDTDHTPPQKGTDPAPSLTTDLPAPLPDPAPSLTTDLPAPLPDPAPAEAVRDEPMVFATTSRRFHLEYEVKHGLVVKEVQLWGTLDHGKSWQKWGLDTDQSSPLHVATHEDGLYGFRIVIVENGGHTENLPAPRADADVWIRVESNEDRP